MVLNRGMFEDGKLETHFGLITERHTVHVQIRKVDDDHTEVRIPTTTH